MSDSPACVLPSVALTRAVEFLLMFQEVLPIITLNGRAGSYDCYARRGSNAVNTFFRRFAIESVYRSLAATAEVPWRRFKIPEDQFVQLVKLLRI